MLLLSHKFSDIHLKPFLESAWFTYLYGSWKGGRNNQGIFGYCEGNTLRKATLE
jgi:hypothetical protein